MLRRVPFQSRSNINAQHANLHVDLPSEVKDHQTKPSLYDSAELAARMGMVYYISTLRAAPSFLKTGLTHINSRPRGIAYYLNDH
jgi:hypothetical protein